LTGWDVARKPLFCLNGKNDFSTFMNCFQRKPVLKTVVMKRMIPSLNVFILIVFSSFILKIADAQTLLKENFEYPGGTLLTASGWTAHSGSGSQPVDVVVPGLSFTGYPLSNIGGAAQLDNTGEDVSRNFPVQTSGAVYVACMVKVNTAASLYFMHLGGDPIGTTFRGKVFVDGTGDPFNFGVSVGSNTATTVPGGSFQIGKTYLMVLKHEIVEGEKNDKVSLYIFSSDVPATEPATPTIGPLTDAGQTEINPGNIALRQAVATQNIVVDGIRIGKTWADAVTAPAGSDTTPPVFSSGYPKITDIRSTSVKIQVSMDEPGRVYFVVMADGSVAPTAAEVFSLTPSSGGLAGGSMDIASGGVIYSHTITNLSDKTSYDAYFIAQDDQAAPNKQTAPVLVEFFTEQPKDTLLNVDFISSLAPFIPVSVKGEQVWTRTEYSNNGYAYMNGYSGGAVENSDWLISPAISVENAGSLGFSFRTAKNYSGPDLKVMISVQFNGNYTVEGINPAIWTDITSGLKFSTGSFTWVSSGQYDLSAFKTGKIYIAFVYESTTSGAAAWELDDFVVTGYKNETRVDDIEKNQIGIYPVPAREEVYFNNANDVTGIEIFDISGKMHVSQNWNGIPSGKINISHLSGGVYFIRFSGEKGVVVEKIIKE
jgi:hypothetical protein